MAVHDQYAGIDQNIAANVRAYREAASISQEELAQQMTDRGFAFSQATIWKIESGQRPVKASELVAFAHCLRVLSFSSLTDEPEGTRHRAQLRYANYAALTAFEQLKAAADAYLEAQTVALVTARSAHDDGVVLTELDTPWLDIPAERAVLEARIERDHEDSIGDLLVGEVDKIEAALRAAGYQATWRIEDVIVEGGSPPPERVSPASSPLAAEEPGLPTSVQRPPGHGQAT